MNQQSTFDPADIEQNKVISALSYFAILFFLPLVAAPNSKFGRFHANQSLLLLIFCIITGIVSAIVGWIPFVGSLISTLLGLIDIVLVLYGLINTLQGKAIELPFIGHIRLINP